MANWFRRLGRGMRHKFTTTKWLFYEFTGTDEESRRMEREAGQALADLLADQFPPLQNASFRDYLRDLGDYLGSHLGASSYRFSYTPVASPSINAFALPGGLIFVTRGLLEFTKWERDEIAFAVAHEIGHVSCRHARDKLVANALKKGLGILVPHTRIHRALASLSDAYVFSEYSQDCEFEADLFAARLLVKAGMNPLAGRSFLRRLGSTTGSDSSSATDRFFRSHPPIEERIRRIERV